MEQKQKALLGIEEEILKGKGRLLEEKWKTIKIQKKRKSRGG